MEAYLVVETAEANAAQTPGKDVVRICDNRGEQQNAAPP